MVGLSVGALEGVIDGLIIGYVVGDWDCNIVGENDVAFIAAVVKNIEEIANKISMTENSRPLGILVVIFEK